MKLLILVLFGIVAGVAAQETNETPPQTPPPADAVTMQVQTEEFIARKYLELMLKIQHAQYASQAASSFARVYVNDDSGFGNGMYGSSFIEEDNMDETHLQFMGSYQMYYATKIKFFQTVIRANDLQREYWMDRAAQLSVGGADAGAPVYQFLYMKLVKTNLETMRLSLALQYISHFTMWLEDELDVNSVVIRQTEEADIVVNDQADDLVRDKIWAFTAYNSHAMVDFSIFYIDLYLEYLYAAILGPPAEPPANAEEPQPQGTASLLETESTAQPSQFIPAMAYGYNPMLYMKFYKMYYLWCQMNAAHSGLNGALAAKMAFDGEQDDDTNYTQYSEHMFAAFSLNLLYASQLEYLTGIFELYTMFAGGAGSFGSLGNSFGSSLGSI